MWTWLRDRFQEQKMYVMEDSAVILFPMGYPPHLYMMKTIDPTWQPYIPSEYDVRECFRVIFGGAK